MALVLEPWWKASSLRVGVEESMRRTPAEEREWVRKGQRGVGVRVRGEGGEEEEVVVGREIRATVPPGML